MANDRSDKTSPLTPFQNPLFRGLWTANVLSTIGGYINDVGAAWLMTSLSSSPLMVSLIQVASNAPFFLLALPAGALGDILDKRKLLLLTQNAMMLLSALLGVLTLLRVTAMQGLRRQRMRTGAFQWGLYSDAADPSRYVETFLNESWAEHLRQHGRVTPCYRTYGHFGPALDRTRHAYRRLGVSDLWGRRHGEEKRAGFPRAARMTRPAKLDMHGRQPLCIAHISNEILSHDDAGRTTAPFGVGGPKRRWSGGRTFIRVCRPARGYATRLKQFGVLSLSAEPVCL